MSKLILEIAEDYFRWRKTVQVIAPHTVTFEAYLASYLSPKETKELGDSDE
jgi:hypothetical protein